MGGRSLKYDVFCIVIGDDVALSHVARVMLEDLMGL